MTPQVPNDDKRITFNPLTLLSLKQHSALFVDPPHFPQQPEDDKQRLFMIVGAEGSGKKIAAVNLAVRISQQEQMLNQSSNDSTRETLPIKIYQHRESIPFDLNTILSEPESSGIFIILDVHQYRVKADDFASDKVDYYNAQLRKHKAYFIFTADEQKFERIQEIGIKPYSTQGVMLESVIKTHENYYLKADQIPDQPLVVHLRRPETRQELEKLKTPKNIGIFFQNLTRASLRDGEESNEVKRLIQSILRNDTPELRRWFRGLPMNIKLFVMTMASLLDNNYTIDRFAAEELYFAFIQKVRQKPGLDRESVFTDPRIVGFDDVIATANMFFEDTTLTFNSDELRESILSHEIDSYQSLLWILAEMLVDHIAPPPQKHVPNPAVYQYIGDPDAPSLMFENAQEVLANLVGTVGIRRKDRLRDLLLRLGEMGNQVELAGQLLFPIARKPEHHPFYFEILERWLYPKDQNGKVSEFYRPEEVMTALYALKSTYAAAALHEPTRQKLQKYIVDAAKISSALEHFITQKEDERSQEIQNEIDTLRAERGKNAVTETDIQKRQNQKQTEIAQLTLFTTELITIFILLMLNDIAQQYPQDVVQIINEWLKNGLNQVASEEYELDDDADIERMLRIEDSSALNTELARAARQRQKRKRRIVLQNMQWHIGMLSAVMFFDAEANNLSYQSDESRDDEDAIDTDTPDAPTTENESRSTFTTATPEHDTASDALPVSEDATDEEMPSETPESLTTSDQEDLADNGSKHEANLRKPKREEDISAVVKSEDAKEDKSPESTDRKHQSAGIAAPKKNNRIAIVQKMFPFLDLLPNLLASANITFSEMSFLENMSRGESLLEYAKKGQIYYQFDVPYSFLQRDPLRAAFRMMHEWYKVMVDNPKNPDKDGQKEWLENVFPALLKLFNNATQGQRPLLRQILFAEGWIESPYAEIRSVAHALLARSFILDGRILDLPANRYGIVLLDWGTRDYEWDRYYRSAYTIIQQLSAMTPIKIYALGSSKLIKEIASRHNEPQLLMRELRPHRTSPRLLTPLFEDDAMLTDPANTHFVLALTPLESLGYDPTNSTTKPDILDLLDLTELEQQSVPAIDPQLQKIVDSNLYKENDPQKVEARRKLAEQSRAGSSWQWSQKLFLLTPDKESILNQFASRSTSKTNTQSVDIEKLFSLVDVYDRTFLSDTDNIVNAISLKLGKNLHTLKNPQWQDDLYAIWKGDETVFGIDNTFRFDDPHSIEQHLQTWIDSLEDVTKARHPRDVTMTIIWAVLAFSKHNLTKAVAMVARWLKSDSEANTIVGLACAKTLYNFYALAPDLYEQPQNYFSLLELLPSIMGIERGQDSSEFSPFINIIMTLARHEAWYNQLTKGEPLYLADALRNIRDRNSLYGLRVLVTLQQLFIRIARLYAQMKVSMSWMEFRQFMHEMAVEYNRTPSKPQQQKFHDWTYGKTSADDIKRGVVLLDEISKQLSDAYATSLGVDMLTAVSAENVRELVKNSPEELEKIDDRVRNIANFIILHSMRKLDIKMPELPHGQKYGVILIRGTSAARGKDLRSHVIGFVKEVRGRLKDSRGDRTTIDDIVFTIHHIGRRELIYNNSATPPNQVTLRLPDQISEPPLLITPILESYRQEEVAFVLIVSDHQPIDLADWFDEQEWINKIYLFGRGRAAWIDDFYGNDEKRKENIKEGITKITNLIMELLGLNSNKD